MKPTPKSKYREKHYETIEFNLFDEQCPFCEKVCAVDLSHCEHGVNIAFETLAKVFCPYCGKSFYVYD